MGMTLKLTQNVLNTYVDWKAQVLHDLHESVPFLYDNTIGDGPFNAWIDPLLTNEWQMIGWNNVQEMTRFGMPGVFTHGTFDTWSPGYLMFIAATHNGISRLYETFGNGGTAETVERTLSPSETAAHVVSPEPAAAAGEVVAPQQQQLRADGIARLAQLLREQSAAVPRELLSEEQAVGHEGARGGSGGVRACRRTIRRPGAQAELLNVLRKQAVEISRATAPFTVTVPSPGTASARRARRGFLGAGWRRIRRARAGLRSDDDAHVPGRHRTSCAWTSRTRGSPTRCSTTSTGRPNDPQKNPYDDTGWTFPEGFSVQAVRVTDVKVLDAPMERVTADDPRPAAYRHRNGVRDQP